MFKFHHVSLSIKFLEKTIEFYNALGFKEVLRWQAEDKSVQIIQLKLYDCFLELFYYKDHSPPPKTSHRLETDLPTIGIKHFALRVPSIELAKEEIIRLGFADDITITHGRTGIDYFFIKDSNGIFVEIVQDNRDFSYINN